MRRKLRDELSSVLYVRVVTHTSPPRHPTRSDELRNHTARDPRTRRDVLQTQPIRLLLYCTRQKKTQPLRLLLYSENPGKSEFQKMQS